MAHFILACVLSLFSLSSFGGQPTATLSSIVASIDYSEPEHRFSFPMYSTESYGAAFLEFASNLKVSPNCAGFIFLVNGKFGKQLFCAPNGDRSLAFTFADVTHEVEEEGSTGRFIQELKYGSNVTLTGTPDQYTLNISSPN